MNVLITGVAGLFGSRLADFLIEKTESNVIGIDDLSGGYETNVNSKVNFFNIELSSEVDKLNDIFEKHKPDYVYHFAAYAAEGLSPFIRNFNYTNNLISTANIVNNCIIHDVKRLVFASSIAVYGENETPFLESMDRKPIDPYGVAKAACEMDIEISGEQHGLDWCILRPHNVYGKKQNIWDRYRNVLGIWMYNYLNNEPLTIFGDGEQTRAFSHIDDCLLPFWKAATDERASKQIINVGGLKECTVNKACDILIDVMGGGEKQYLEERHEVKHAFSDYQKSVSILDYEDTTSLKEGIQDMWDWAKYQPMRDRPVMNYEIEKGMYSFWKQGD
ncbi:UDP-glucose 4-epimerase [Candidatus Pacearchaeota archaeon]|nr:UDP-glucose 4-epimerase [Candidatus Pacearchaeota archaeon]|tara:strand:+ start:2442 stop:3437 length:996 start_codon:yes stop_codon:yes gene_type:complete